MNKSEKEIIKQFPNATDRKRIRDYDYRQYYGEYPELKRDRGDQLRYYSVTWSCDLLIIATVAVIVGLLLLIYSPSILKAFKSLPI